MTVVFLIMNVEHGAIYFHIAREHKTNIQTHKFNNFDLSDFQNLCVSKAYLGMGILISRVNCKDISANIILAFALRCM